ncbi:MAG TPA: Hsp20/alpha crystallin family protein [Ferruginibacter sp.]|nr:Hsp20/alpha crystallin family protein [Ferruginibacter sp.]HRE63200.1 Hsp20/alpha crystallin family protein [Ferruginibacter sp.]
MTLVKVNNGFGKTFDGMMKDFFNEFPATVSKTFREDVLHFPPVNIMEKENSYGVELSVPGFEKADFNVKLEGNVLTISTEKKEEINETTDKMVRKEFSHKSFKRSFTLDEKIDADNISARYENGILKLELPKKENQKTAAKDINIQ